MNRALNYMDDVAIMNAICEFLLRQRNAGDVAICMSDAVLGSHRDLSCVTLAECLHALKQREFSGRVARYVG